MRARPEAGALALKYERRLWGLVLAANYFGIAILLLYALVAIPIYPEPTRGAGRVVLELLVPGLPLIGLFSVIGMLHARTKIRPAMRWIVEQREPTHEERSQVSSLPRSLATVGVMYWLIGGTVLFPYLVVVIRYRIPVSGMVRSVVAFALLSLVPWSLTYLLIERALRPIYTSAFAGHASFPRSMGIPSRLLLAWLVTSGLPILGVFMIFVAQDATHRARAIPAVFMICAAGAVAGVIVAVFSGRAIIDPLAEVRSAMRAIEGGDLDVHIPINESAELGELQAGVNRMVVGLRERERMREIFSRHVGADVAQRAMESDFSLGGETVDATAMFVDVIGSSALAEEREPGEVVGVLNAFFDAVVRCVGAEGGYVSKFEGDGALCIFGAPIAYPDHAERALRAARALRTELRSLAENIEAAMGISSGYVVAGNVGAADRYEYTIIGDPVNEASRLTEEAKNRHTRVLASERTLERAGLEVANWGQSGVIHLRGRARPTVAFEPGLI